MRKYFAGGFLYHPESGKLLLQWRGTRTSHRPNTWCLLGGWSERQDRGDPRRTWCREMREEIGIILAPDSVVPVCHYRPASSPYHRFVFYHEWPVLTESFSLAPDEDDLEAVKCLTPDEALSHLSGNSLRDLSLFLEHPRTAEPA